MYSIRFARPEDAAALLDIYRPYVTDTGITFETDIPTVEEFRSRIVETMHVYPYLVLETDGDILGYAYAHRFRERAAYDWCAEPSIYLRMDQTGKGYGKPLYSALMALLAQMGIYSLCAVITYPNPRSIAFHEAMGFENAGITPSVGFKAGNWYGTAYLYKTLGQLPATPVSPAPVTALPDYIVQNILKNS